MKELIEQVVGIQKSIRFIFQ